MGKRRGSVAAAVAGMLVFAGPGFGEESAVKLTPTGYASYAVGQVVQANPITAEQATNSPQVDHLLSQQTFIGFNVQAAYDPLPITTNIGVEMKAFTETPRSTTTWYDQGSATRMYYFFYLTRADLVYSPSEAFNLDLGYFPVKYSDDARNLGEYLFRSGTYPQYLITNFDFAAARVTGLNVYGTLLGSLKYRALLTINTEYATMCDLNFTAIASYSLLDKFFELGSGVSFCSFISANATRTRPDTSIVGGNTRGKYIDENGDTTTYTFAGTKLMGRLAIDPKALFKSDIFGKEDLKLYAEAAILGIKNYPVSLDTTTTGTRYDDIVKRIPVMFGFNFPTFKFFDVLNMEWEWFGSIYPNDMTSYVKDGFPIPMSNMWTNKGFYADSARDNWKWSFYAKKTFAGHFNVVAQVASDHLRWDRSAVYSEQANLMSEALTQRKHKYYVVKLGYSF